MASPIECLTLNTLEWPKDAVVCSLSDILETGEVPRRFFLSATDCRGILRRAEKRGKKLPAQLQQALSAVVQVGESTEQLRNTSKLLAHSVVEHQVVAG